MHEKITFTRYPIRVQLSWMMGVNVLVLHAEGQKIISRTEPQTQKWLPETLRIAQGVGFGKRGSLTIKVQYFRLHRLPRLPHDLLLILFLSFVAIRDNKCPAGTEGGHRGHQDVAWEISTALE